MKDLDTSLANQIEKLLHSFDLGLYSLSEIETLEETNVNILAKNLPQPSSHSNMFRTQQNAFDDVVGKS